MVRAYAVILKKKKSFGINENYACCVSSLLFVVVVWKGSHSSQPSKGRATGFVIFVKKCSFFMYLCRNLKKRRPQTTSSDFIWERINGKDVLRSARCANTAVSKQLFILGSVLDSFLFFLFLFWVNDSSPEEMSRQEQRRDSRCNGEVGSRQRADFSHLLGFLQGDLLAGGLLFLLLVLQGGAEQSRGGEGIGKARDE